VNLATTITVFAGGPGSGCNPEVGHCGRPTEDAAPASEHFKAGSDTAKVYEHLAHGEWRSLKDTQSELGGINVKSRLGAVDRRGRSTGKFYVEFGPSGMVRVLHKGQEGYKEQAPKEKKTRAPREAKDSGTVKEPRRKGTAGLEPMNYARGKDAVEKNYGRAYGKYGSVRVGFNTMLQRGMDARLIETNRCKIDGNASGRGLGPTGYYSGKYNWLANKLSMARGYSGEHGADTFIHEWGHHLDYNYLNRFGGINEKFDYNAAHQDRVHALSEMTEEKTRLEMEHGTNKVRFDHKNIASNYGVRTKAPSYYAMYNDKEWIAESFREYYGNRERLSDNNPKTFKLIDNLVNGRYHK
jgi:hypothetical protein